MAGLPRRQVLAIEATGILGVLAPGPAEPVIVAHRAGAGRFPENTARAVREVAPAVDAVEIDVRRCGSGDLVAFHDRTVDRLTDASGPVDSFSIHELTRLRVQGTSATIDRFETVLGAVPSDTRVFVDLKEDEIVHAVTEAVANVDTEVAVLSSESDRLLAYAALDPSASRWLVTSEMRGGHAWTTIASSGVLVPLDRLVREPFLSERTRIDGRRLGTWTVRSTPEAWTAIRIGADVLFVDRPHVI